MSSQITCIYRNLADRAQVVRIAEKFCYLEKIVLPKQCLMFEAPPEACLEIHEDITSIQSDSIPCLQLLALKTDAIRNRRLSEVAY